MKKNIFTEHPHSIGESYLEHLKFASQFGFNMLIGSLACLLHAIFPFICKNTGSDYLFKMTHVFVDRMPCTEKRISVLTDVLEKKRAKSK